MQKLNVSKPIGAYRLNERYIKGVDMKLSLPHMISNDVENLQSINDKDDLCKFLDERIAKSLELIDL